MTIHSVRMALFLITLAGGLLRFVALGAQSFSPDEGVTVGLLERGFGDMLDTIPASESTPPLYYSLAWVWTQVFGTGEVGVRSLSALFGTIAIPVVYVAGTELIGRRAGVIAAALTAVSPLLVWYSQEGRAYSLLVLLVAASLVFFGRAIARGSGRPLLWWAVCCGLALATHYYAVFVVAPQGAWLLLAIRDRAARRRALLATGSMVAVGLALLPLALEQRSTRNFSRFIEDISLSQRAKEAPKKFILGEQGTPGDYGAAEPLLFVIALLVVAALVLLAWRATAGERRAAAPLAAVAAAGIGIPVAMALAGFDYFAAYLLIGAWVPGAVVVAAGFAVRGGAPAGRALAGALIAASLGVTLYAATSDTLQRWDFRAAASAIGDPPGERVLVLTPDGSPAPLRAYARGIGPLPAERVDVREVAVVGMRSKDESTRSRADTLRPPPGGFREVERIERAEFTLVRFRAPEPVRLTADQLATAAMGEGLAAVVVQR